jgi:hypothetical protein
LSFIGFKKAEQELTDESEQGCRGAPMLRLCTFRQLAALSCGGFLQKPFAICKSLIYLIFIVWIKNGRSVVEPHGLGVC